MGSPISFDIKGIKELTNKLDKLPANLKKEIAAELGLSAENIANRAKVDAPVDEGRLRQGITSAKKSDLLFDIVSNASYSPFIEWGTRRNVSVPADLAAYAANFKGPSGGGSVEDALRSIQGWVKRKGIKFDSAGKFKSGKKKGQNKRLTVEQTAYIIFHFINIRGIKPRPFFFHNLKKEEPELIKHIQNILSSL